MPLILMGGNDNMKRSRKLISLRVVIAFVLVMLVLFAIIVRERQLSKQLSKEVEMLKKQTNIIPPYYDKQVFVKPKNVPTSTLKQHDLQIKIPVIMYHYVEYTKDMKDIIRLRLDTSPAVFEGHLIALKNAGYESYFVKDIPDILNGTVHYSTRSAILTFDDGYEDFYTSVFPLLKKYHMRATTYIIFDYIGRPGFLNKKQIQELIESDLVEIGSHTLDHTYLKFAQKEYADTQIIESKKRFEDTFNIKIKTFAYPYGAFNADNIKTVEKAGYTCAVSVISGTMQSFDNQFYLSRIRPGLFSPHSMISVIESMQK